MEGVNRSDNGRPFQESGPASSRERPSQSSSIFRNHRTAELHQVMGRASGNLRRDQMEHALQVIEILKNISHILRHPDKFSYANEEGWKSGASPSCVAHQESRREIAQI